MSLSMYDASIPVLIRGLNNLATILTKAAAYAEAKKIAPEVLVNARLAPDMYPLSRQIQIATDMAKGCGARLAKLEVPSFADTETTFPELQERIAKTIAFLKTIQHAQVEGSEERDVVVKTRGREHTFKGKDYLLNFVLPNFYFHTTTTYAILRHNGLEIGKADFIGSL
ncbi:MAG TPA: DUF1993 domain-containing protein [Rickettsiales bacterium]|nr:DUF1993 domain-containing protein [Rickettsiales bacterium]